MKFITELGKSIPILELLLLICCLQWIIGPINSYLSSFRHYKYHMYIDEYRYMSFIVPSVFFFGIVLLKLRKEVKINFNVRPYLKLGFQFIIIGILSDFLKLVVPNSLKFVIFLFSQLKFVGILILIFSETKRSKLTALGIIWYLVIHALSSAMFHELILWSIFYFIFWCVKVRPSLKVKLSIIILGILLGIIIQTVKSNYRQLVWNGYSGNKISLFIDVFSSKINTGFYDDQENIQGLNIRLNQGWIISAIMNNVPSNQPYANGSTIYDAITSSLIPRIFNPNKKIAGGRENFMKYTGLQLGESTSMGLSIVGEFYANFGEFGGILSLILWAFFLSFIWNKIRIFTLKNPLWVFLLPLVFLQVIKAETELVVVLNHLIKSILFVYFLLFFINKFKLSNT
ncbi:hypothetical protein [Flammeovirga sp. SubArs3]|uniref:hypothetical protein n=1 Tax=Flammeovirga sp. SubArs3 TaxID=2995316 RepID=UPI00248BBE58|nr:hypothetical protein [Flammeovirga sp. SubArs3]